MARSVLLIVNRDKPRVVAALDRFRQTISRYGTLAGEIDASGPSEPDPKGADLIMVLGGDGTILAQSRRCVGLDLPIIGVDFGRLGFLAEFNIEDFESQAESLLGGGPLELRERALLRTEIYAPKTGNDEPTASGLAMNDAVVTNGPPFRMIEIGLRINGTDGPVINGDGVVVSTPVGSTGYSVSAGGPIVAPGLDALTIASIAAHSLAFRPIVVPGSASIELTILRANAMPGCESAKSGPFSAGGTTLVLDGQVLYPLRGGERIVLRTNKDRVRLVHNPRSSYWQTLMEKMHWGVAPSGSRA